MGTVSFAKCEKTGVYFRTREEFRLRMWINGDPANRHAVEDPGISYPSYDALGFAYKFDGKTRPAT